MSEEIKTTAIAQDEPVRFEWRNFKRSYTHRNKSYRVSFEVDEETWISLNTMPDDADGEMVTWWTNRNSEEPARIEPKIKLVKGAYSEFWDVLFGKFTFANRPDVRDFLSADTPAAVKPYLHAAFCVETLSIVSPDQLREYFKELPSLNVVINQAETMAKQKSAA